MGDEDDRFAFGDKSANDREQAFDLLGSEHRGGFVQDQQARSSIKRLEDLHPLLKADGKLGDALSRVDLKPEPL